jgi:Zn-dependent peptidase ImmA (M78 family)/DNA-binding XRE family transcriptional regulator
MVDSPLSNLRPHELGHRLQSARKVSGLTQQFAADHLGVARTTLVAMEKGERRVQPLELVRLAELYGMSLHEALRHRTGKRLAVQLRAAFSGDASVEEELMPYVDVLEQLCENFVELEHLAGSGARRYPEPYDISAVSPERAAEDVASTERNRLGLGDGPILNLRAVLENDAGLRIFYLPLPNRVAAMFGHTEELGGCIAINRNHPPEKRRLSAAHEFGHFITRRDRAEVTVLSRYQRVPEHERFADTFSYAFLMPASGISRRYNELRRSRGGKATVADICHLAHLYFVSVEAMVLRLEHLRLISAGTWDRLNEAKFQVREAQALLNLPAQPIDDQLMPSRYRYLAAEAYVRGDITETQLATFLRTDRSTAREVVAALAGPVAVDAVGVVGNVQLDLGLAV